MAKDKITIKVPTGKKRQTKKELKEMGYEVVEQSAIERLSDPDTGKSGLGVRDGIPYLPEFKNLDPRKLRRKAWARRK